MSIPLLYFLQIQLFGLCLLGLPPAEEGRFAVTIENIQEQRGRIQLAVFASESAFLKDSEACYTREIRSFEGGTAELTLPPLPLGYYAIAVFHDLNSDGKLNTNLWGIPVEPYAFSRPPASKWDKPSFQQTRVHLASEGMAVRMELKRWKDL